MDLGEDIFLKFPAILKERLKNGDVVFSTDVLFEYTPTRAFRCVERENDDNTPVTRNDFRSNAELGRKNIKGLPCKEEFYPPYYGVSLYEDRKMLNNKLKLPKPKLKVAEGIVFQEGGPIQKNVNTTHVCWWLYNDTVIDGFKIVD